MEFRQVQPKLVFAALSAVPGLVLGIASFAHIADGFAVDAAIPVPVYMVAQIAVPKAAYRDAVSALKDADPRNGEAIAARAEAALLGGGKPAEQIPLLEESLARSPASARVWTILAESRLATDKRQAVAALNQALVQAPNDFWLIARRARLVGQLWPYLDPETRTAGLSQARMMWEVPALRPQIRTLLATEAGTALMSMALAHNPQELREMNRWLLRQRLASSE